MVTEYLVSNIADRPHQEIYSEIADGAFFDMAPSQQGWEEYLGIRLGDVVYVINKDRVVEDGYVVTGIVDGVLLEDDEVWGEKVKSITGGMVRVLFGKPVEKVNADYSELVLEKNITSNRLNPETGKMYVGFNCAKV